MTSITQRAREAAQTTGNVGFADVQRQLAAIDDERMPRVMASLKAHHAVDVFGEPVDHLALALVAPLRADDDHILCHGFFLRD